MFDPTQLYSDLATMQDRPFTHKQPSHIIYDFDQGVPDATTFPTDDLLRIAQDVLKKYGLEGLNYMNPKYGYGDMTLGLTPLREQIAAMINARDKTNFGPENVIVTTGSVQANALAANAFAGPGDAVFLEPATFPFALRYFAQSGTKVYPVEMDNQGMRMDVLAQAIDESKREGLRPKMIYTIPTFQLPTGLEMSVERRHRLLELASEHNMLIMEDAIYDVFRYDGEAIPTLLSIDTEGRVLQSDSFGKTIAPGTRTGWMIGHEDVIGGMAAVRQDLGSNQWFNMILAEYLAEDLLESHLESLIQTYRPKRDAVAEALDKHCAKWVSYRKPRGGFYFWLELDQSLDWAKIQADMFERGIAMRPGEMFIGQTSGPQYMRLAFGHVSVELIDQGIAELGEVLEGAAKAVPSRP